MPSCATNSSYIGSSKLAAVTARPEQVCNMHFFNPALVMKCVEVVKGPHTAAATAELAMALARRLNKEPVLLHREIYGFLVNRIYRAIVQEACFLLDTGVASVEAIDSAVVNGLGHPMGPFRLLDLTGIDLAYRARMDYYRETMDPADKPPPSIVEKYARGEWGSKSGKGFYDTNLKPLLAGLIFARRDQKMSPGPSIAGPPAAVRLDEPGGNRKNHL